MLATDARFHSPTEILAGENLVQVGRDIGQGEWMVDSADAAAQVPEKSIMDVLFTIVIGDGDPVQALCLKELSEHVFEHIHLQTESIQMLRSGFRAAVGAPSFKEPAFC